MLALTLWLLTPNLHAQWRNFCGQSFKERADPFAILAELTPEHRFHARVQDARQAAVFLGQTLELRTSGSPWIERAPEEIKTLYDGGNLIVGAASAGQNSHIFSGQLLYVRGDSIFFLRADGKLQSMPLRGIQKILVHWAYLGPLLSSEVVHALLDVRRENFTPEAMHPEERLAGALKKVSQKWMSIRADEIHNQMVISGVIQSPPIPLEKNSGHRSTSVYFDGLVLRTFPPTQTDPYTTLELLTLDGPTQVKIDLPTKIYRLIQ